MARSMKEGQYYLTPLYMVALPLMFLTLMPGVELTPFFSLVPITGVALLLKSLMSGQYVIAQTYLLPVVVTTLAYAALALRWAVDQFQSESVLFREAERFELGSYLRHIFRDRGPLPSTGAAVACFAAMLTQAWYVSQLVGGMGALQGTVMIHALVILGVPLVLSLALTTNPLATLRLHWPGLGPIALGAGLALAIHPLASELHPWVARYFPMREDLAKSVEKLFDGVTLPVALAVFALMPAITEEIAFRGFILSGLRKGHSARSAVIISAVLFGLMHVVLSLVQQFFNATLLGIVLGWLALKSRSLFPGIVFHATNNGLAVLAGFLLADAGTRESVRWLYRDTTQGLFAWPWLLLAAGAAGVLLTILTRMPMPVEKAVESDLEGSAPPLPA
jgi:sodium transport system permease protein